MSGLISSLFIEPVVRQARRFSQLSDRPRLQPPSDDDQAESLPRARGNSSPSPYHNGNKGAIMSVKEDSESELDCACTGHGNSPAILPTPSPVDRGSCRHATDNSLETSQNRRRSNHSSTEILSNNSGLSHGASTLENAGFRRSSATITFTQNPSGDTNPSMQVSGHRVEEGRSLDVDGGSFLLPADDGMGVLRRRIHAIRELGSSSADKARMVHELMTENYNASRGNSGDQAFPMEDFPSSPQSPKQLEAPIFHWSQSVDGQSFDIPPTAPASTTSYQQAINPYNLTFKDLKPTFAPGPPEPEYPVDYEEEKDIEECEEACLGCQHYKRNVKLQCYTCKKWYTCRFCHDEEEDHHLNRRKTENMLCMLCGHAQPAAQFCERCSEQAAQYYCDVCKLWDNDSEKSIYHCNDCGICRIGQGLGKDFFHCKTCSVCLPISIEHTHRCIERSTQCDCPICSDYMFTSPESVVVMRCGHSIHHKCLSEYSKSSYRCPICSKTITNMESTFRNLDRAIQSQPMPAEFKDTKALIYCNDCSAKSVVRYHWLGLKCDLCESYNTAQIRLLHGDVLDSLGQDESSGVAASSRLRSSSYTGDEELSPALSSLRVDPSSVPGPSLMSQLSRGRAMSPVISNYFGLPAERESEKSMLTSFLGGQAPKDIDNDAGGEFHIWGTKLRYRYGFLDRETDPVDEASESECEEGKREVNDDGEPSEDSEWEDEEDDDAEDDDDDESIDVFGHR